jgi:hypothetical protein
MDELLQQGITEYKAGRREEARKIFIAVVKKNPDSERAWGWMNNVCNTDQERIHCLNQVLRINPKNDKARQHLDRLLVPAFASELPLSPVSSVPLSPSPSGAKAKGRNSSFTPTQLFVLLGLVVAIFLLFSAAIFFMFVEKDTLATAPSPTNFVAFSANSTSLPTQILPTATQIPTYAYVPTWTPLPSPTSFVVATLVPPTSKPQQVQDNPAAANPPSVNSGSSCSSQLDYAAAMHQYYSDQIDYIHAPLVSLYQSWIDEAVRNRDALGVLEAQRKLDNEQAQVKAEKATENQRYKAEQASINASC